MRRRALLSALAGGTAFLAGCSVRWGPSERREGERETGTRRTTDGLGDAPAAETGSSAARGVVRPRGGSFGSAAVVELATGPRTYALRPDRYRPVDGVTVTTAFDRPATETAPARLAVRVDNTGDESASLATDLLPVVGPAVARPPPGADDAATLVFAPAESSDLAEAVPAVRRGPAGYWRLAESAIPSAWLPETVSLDPGATRRCDRFVVGHPDGAGRPTGDYVVGTDATTLSLSVWNTERPGPSGRSRFTDLGTLHIHRVDAAVSWYHTATDATAVYLQPSTERTTLPASVDFTVVNHATETLSCGHWTLYKLVGGEFHHLWPDDRTATCRTLAPGATKTFRLQAFHGDPPAAGGVGRGAVRGNLGGGRYAVIAGYDDTKAMTGALFELVGDPVDVTPTEDVHATRVGSAVFATATGHATDGRDGTATVVLTRADDATLSLVPEQVLRPRNRVLRNTLPFLRSGVERVVLNTASAVARRTLGPATDSKRFAVDGQGYRIVLSRAS